MREDRKELIPDLLPVLFQLMGNPLEILLFGYILNARFKFL